jgi:hypothetical protein
VNFTGQNVIEIVQSKGAFVRDGGSTSAMPQRDLQSVTTESDPGSRYHDERSASADVVKIGKRNILGTVKKTMST